MELGPNIAVLSYELKPRLACKKLALAAVVCTMFSVVACSSSNTSTEVADEAGISLADPSTPYAQPAPLVALQDDNGRISVIPTIVSGEILAVSGLEVAYTTTELASSVPALIIEANWLHMQSCLDQVSVAPLVVVAPSVSPLTIHDDVIHTIDGIPFATASQRDTPILQIDSEDFDEERVYAYNLRSIMGRLLWSTAGLAVRDYPFECANQVIEP